MTDIQQTVDAVWRMEAAKIVATLTRAVGDVGFAEDLAQEALVDALTQWPDTGVPRNAGAWLTAVAKRKAIDQWRRQDNLDSKYAVLAHELEAQDLDVADEWDPDRIDDDVLRLVFISAHPVLSREGQIALTLRVVGGLTTDEIARAFLTSKATVAARITRAKKALSDAGIPFEVPDRSRIPAAVVRRPLGDLPGLQRRVFRVSRQALDPRRTLQRGTAIGPGTRRRWYPMNRKCTAWCR